MDQTGIVNVRIGKGVKFTNLPEAAVQKLAKDLTFDNPKYKQAEEHGGYVSAYTSPFLRFFAMSSCKTVMWTPRGYIWYMIKWMNKNGYEYVIDDRTLLLPKLNIKFHGKLRDYQQLGVDELSKRYPVGVLEAQTGAGKTVMGIAMIAERKQKTLIVVHNKELLYQWQGAIDKFLKFDCGLAGDGKYEIKDITVGIINTVKNRVMELSEEFGHIIVDECHRCPSTIWTETLSEFPAKYYLGLSATPFRKDGLGNAIYCHIGPKLHKVNQQKLLDSGAVLKPRIVLVKTSYRYGTSFTDEEQDSYAKIISDLTKSEYRNDLICSCINNDLREHKQNVLVVSDRVTHCKEMQRMLKETYKIDSYVLHGKVKNSERKQIVEDVKAGKVKVLIATLSLIGEGFDAPNLAALFMTTPIKFSGRVIQTAGRVLRPEKGKTPRIYDFRDENVRVLRYSGFTRNTIYKKQGW